MKKPIFLLLAFLSFFVFGLGQSLTLNWSAPITVADGNTYGTSWPRVDLTGSNVPVVMWGNVNANEIYVSRLSGGGFTTPVDVVPAGMDAFVANWAGPDMASWEDSVFVTFSSRPASSGKTYVVRSVDGGLTFSDTIQAGNIGNKITRFPAIDIAEGGNPVVTFMLFEPGFLDPSFEVVRSWDGGNTFGPIVQAGNGTQGEACDCCPTDIHVEGSVQVVPFRNNDANVRDNWMAISQNSGASFDTIMQLDFNNWYLQGCPSQGPDATIAGDTVVSFWTTGANGPNEVWMSTLHLPTYAVTSSQQFDAIPSGGQFKPRVFAKGDTIAAIWEDGRNGNLDCYFAWSVSGPSGLRANIQNAVAIPGGAQQMPDVVFANGTFHVVYSDFTNDEIVYRSGTLGTSTNVDQDWGLSNIKMYPNPVSSNLRVQVPSDLHQTIQFRLTDLSGKVVIEKQNDPVSFDLSLADLNEGIYFAEFGTSSGMFGQKRKIVVIH